MNSMLKYAEIEAIATGIDSCKDNAANLLEQIKSVYNATIPEVWSGNAANTTKTEFDELSGSFVKFTEAIDSETKYLRDTIAKYKEADAAVQAAMQSKA